MKSRKTRRLLKHYEAAEMLNLTMEDNQWLVDTGQLREIRIRGDRRPDARDVDRLLTFYKRVQDEEQTAPCRVSKYSNSMKAKSPAKSVGKLCRHEVTGFWYQMKGDSLHHLGGLGFLYHFQSEFFGFFEACQVAASRDLMGEFVRRFLSESPVRPTLIVLPAPALDNLTGFGQAPEPVSIQAPWPEGPVE